MINQRKRIFQEVLVGLFFGIFFGLLPVLSDNYEFIAILYTIILVVFMGYHIYQIKDPIVSQPPQSHDDPPQQTTIARQTVTEAEERHFEYPNGVAVTARRVRYWQ